MSWAGIAFASQFGLLAWIAGLGAPGVAGGVALGIAGTAVAWRWFSSRAPAALAMLAFGGLGMTLGWWADLGLRSGAELAAHAREPVDLLWCRSGAGPAALSGVPSLGHLFSWMNAGMLAFGFPAVVRARRRARSEPDHGACAHALCAVAMVFGMAAGSLAAAAIAVRLTPCEVVLADWLFMSAGMLAAMALIERSMAILALVRARARRGAPPVRPVHEHGRNWRVPSTGPMATHAFPPLREELARDLAPDYSP